MKVVKLDPEYYPGRQWGHWCPACSSGHEINVDEPNSGGAKWSFDGNLDRPTFSPSVNLQINPRGHEHYQPDLGSTVCHYFITAGKIVYCGDCTHPMAGKTVDLPELPAHAFMTSQRMAQKR